MSNITPIRRMSYAELGVIDPTLSHTVKYVDSSSLSSSRSRRSHDGLNLMVSREKKSEEFQYIALKNHGPPVADAIEIEKEDVDVTMSRLVPIPGSGTLSERSDIGVDISSSQGRLTVTGLPWSDTEDSMLADEVRKALQFKIGTSIEQYPTKLPDGCWAKVSQVMFQLGTGRTAVTCSQRWCRYIKPKLIAAEKLAGKKAREEAMKAKRTRGGGRVLVAYDREVGKRAKRATSTRKPRNSTEDGREQDEEMNALRLLMGLNKQE